MSDRTPPWLEVLPGDEPLIVSMPHTGTEIPADIGGKLLSAWRARKDADWYVERLYDFAPTLGATVIRTRLSRTVIDANRDPTGASLYPGQATTELCPTTTFDGEPLYASGQEPSAAEIDARRRAFFEPYHAALGAHIARLKAEHGRVVLYDCHSIRSQIPRLFAGELPHLNIGTFAGASCAPELTASVERACEDGVLGRVTNGRFKGGYTTRHYGRPGSHIHALQMEIACRAYLREPCGPVDATNWPAPYDEARAAHLRSLLRGVLEACLEFARG